MKKLEAPDDVSSWFRSAIRQIWPVADGSLSLRKCPCIRKNCAACATGEGHRSYVLYGRRKSRRFSLYVPEELVPEVRKALANGNHMKEILNDAGVRFITALKNHRKTRSPKQ